MYKIEKNGKKPKGRRRAGIEVVMEYSLDHLQFSRFLQRHYENIRSILNSVTAGKWMFSQTVGIHQIVVVGVWVRKRKSNLNEGHLQLDLLLWWNIGVD